MKEFVVGREGNADVEVLIVGEGSKHNIVILASFSPSHPPPCLIPYLSQKSGSITMLINSLKNRYKLFF